jgi:hypothetical protein
MAPRIAILTALAAISCSARELGPSRLPSVDGGVPGVPTITVTTRSPALSVALGGKISATWAAYRKEDGSWTTLAESSPSTYVFQSRADRWAVAFACSDGGDNSLVAFHEDAIAVTTFDVELDTWCSGQNADTWTISGTLRNVTPATGWLDFGYPLETRGVILPIDGLDGKSASYEEVNVAAGSWDLTFGVRNDPAASLWKVAIVRNQDLNKDSTIDIDFGGAGAMTPGTQKIALHGIDPVNENVVLPVYYTTNGGVRGIDLGPQSIPRATDLDLVYSTLPQSVPLDRYRIEARVTTTDDTGMRGVDVSFHDAVPVDLMLVAAMPAPTVTSAGAAATTPARPAAASYQLDVVAKVSNRSSRAWRTSLGAALPGLGPNVTLMLPDLSAVPGFDATWALPPSVTRDVTVTVHEKPVSLGDGTAVHSVSRTSQLP